MVFASGLSRIAILSFLIGSVLVTVTAEAQLPPGVSVHFGPDGTNYINGEINQKEYDALSKALNADDTGGVSPAGYCDGLMSQIPSGGILGGIGAFLGICPAESELVSKELKNTVFPKLKEACESMTGVYPTTIATNGCEFDADMYLDCKFTEPPVDPSCDGLRKLCESAGVDGGMSPPDKSGPGQIFISMVIPGCECEADYVIFASGCLVPTIEY